MDIQFAPEDEQYIKECVKNGYCSSEAEVVRNAVRLAREQMEATCHDLPEQMRVKVARVVNSETLGRLIGNSTVTAFHADDDISKEAKRIAASLFDYMSDMAELYHEVSFSERLVIHSELGKILKELESLGAAVYSALRTTKTAGGHQENEPSMLLIIGYLTIVPAKKDVQEISVPRRIS